MDLSDDAAVWRAFRSITTTEARILCLRYSRHLAKLYPIEDIFDPKAAHSVERSAAGVDMTDAIAAAIIFQSIETR